MTATPWFSACIHIPIQPLGITPRQRPAYALMKYIPLSLYYRRHLERNQIVPITHDDWERPPEVEFELYGLLGLPEELFDRQKRVSVSGNRIIGGVQARFAGGTGVGTWPGWDFPR